METAKIIESAETALQQAEQAKRGSNSSFLFSQEASAYALVAIAKALHNRKEPVVITNMAENAHISVNTDGVELTVDRDEDNILC